MKRLAVFFVIIVSVLLSSVVYAQQSVTVSWKGELNCQEITIDSVLVTNLTKSWTTTVFYPEQSIILHTSVGIDDPKDFAKTQIQVKPNPFSQTAEVDFYVGKEGLVSLTLYDIFGRTVASLSQQMECGQQQVVVNMGSSGYYFLSIETPTEKRVAKLLSMYDGNGDAGITSTRHCEGDSPKQSSVVRHCGLDPQSPDYNVVAKKQKSDPDLPFDLGDSLQFIAYATDSNGKVHEYLPQSYKILEDKELLFIHSPVDYTLESGCEWNFTAMQEDSLYVINSLQELLAFLDCDADSTLPAIDFTKYSLLLAHGNTIYGSIANISKTLIQLSANDYKLNVEISLSDTMDSEPWQIAMIVPKVNKVLLNLYYPHIEVWECFFEPYLGWHPDITITLTLDTLLSKFYVSTVPEELTFWYSSCWQISYRFADSTKGRYIIEEDTIQLIYYDDIGNIIYHIDFSLTIYSPNSMLLHYEPIHYIPEYIEVKDYLFIKQD